MDLKPVFLLAVCGVLAGCGGSGENANLTKDATEIEDPALQIGPLQNQYQAKLERADALLGDIRDRDIDTLSSCDALPTGGTSQYEGVIGLEGEDYDLVGDVYLSVRFDGASDSETLNGTAEDFVSSTGYSYDGELTISGTGRLSDPDDPVAGFTADIQGTLVGDDENTLDLNGSLAGAYGFEIPEGADPNDIEDTAPAAIISAGALNDGNGGGSFDTELVLEHSGHSSGSR